jgi:hypothetical protein
MSWPSDISSAAEMVTSSDVDFSRSTNYSVIACLYFALCYPLSQLLLLLERKIRAGVPLVPRRRRRMKAVRALLDEGVHA